jgi:hypothetical protein
MPCDSRTFPPRFEARWLPRRISALAVILFALSALAGCEGTFKNQVNFSPVEPLRVAVLPFVQVNDKDEIVESDPNLLIDNVGLVSSKLQQTPPEFVRALVQNELAKTSLDLVAPAVVDAQISHHGYVDQKKLDLKKLYATDSKELCAKLLYCDALLYGKVTKWDRSYYGIQSVTTVAVDLKLISGRDGKVLFTSSGEDSDSRGITKGPTGFSNLVIEPLKGLDSELVTDLARGIVKKLVSPLKVESRPEFLQTSPPAILASAEDSDDGRIPRNGRLTVLLLGTAKKKASFTIDQVADHIPMIERDSGHYVGYYYPLPSDTFSNRPIFVDLTDEFGRTTRQKLGRIDVSLK